jgi:Mg2+ and Co2+ transporter CorA
MAAKRSRTRSPASSRHGPILAVPTAVAGIHGMNFQSMPELHWKYGYYVVIGAIAVLCD